MYEVNCFDEFGKRIDVLYQWDFSYEVFIKLQDFFQKDTDNMSVAFKTNKIRNEIIGNYEIDDQYIIVKIPDEIMAVNSLLYIIFYDGQSQKIGTVKIPIRKQNRPDHNYHVGG